MCYRHGKDFLLTPLPRCNKLSHDSLSPVFEDCRSSRLFWRSRLIRVEDEARAGVRIVYRCGSARHAIWVDVRVIIIRHFAQLNRFPKEASRMKRYLGSWLVVCIVAGCAITLQAQGGGEGAMSPPKVLVVAREFLKPGKGGSPHEKTESAFVQAFTAAKWPTHYLGTDALSGPGRSVFFVGFDSFEAWEKDTKATFANPTLAAALDRASIADGDLLSSSETNVFSYREDLSYHAPVNIAQMRYFEAISFRTKPGHEQEWEATAKMYVDNYGKVDPNAHWATYQAMYGHNLGGVYVVLVPMKSLAEVDTGIASGKKFMEQLGESGMKKMAELSAASTESTEDNLLMFNPKISYVADAWVKADPSFWKPKAAAAPAKKSEAKPAQ